MNQGHYDENNQWVCGGCVAEGLEVHMFDCPTRIKNLEKENADLRAQVEKLQSYSDKQAEKWLKIDADLRAELALWHEYGTIKHKLDCGGRYHDKDCTCGLVEKRAALKRREGE